MSRKIIAGNWKMNLLHQEAQELLQATNVYLNELNPQKIEVVVSPNFTQLEMALHSSTHKKLNVAAQNMAAEDFGAFTGEVSGKMLADIGIDIVILGHSERREVFLESDDLIHKKLHKALELNFLPILCVGESLPTRQAGEHFNFVKSQLDSALEGVSSVQAENIVIAYEPIWAIGTGETASPEQAQEMHAYIRKYLSGRYDVTTADDISILYGGSVKPSNARDLFGQPDVDGGLIGGASLKADSFRELIKIGEEILR